MSDAQVKAGLASGDILYADILRWLGVIRTGNVVCLPPPPVQRYAPTAADVAYALATKQARRFPIELTRTKGEL